jgi:hypothetical protein
MLEVPVRGGNGREKSRCLPFLAVSVHVWVENFPIRTLPIECNLAEEFL